VDNHIADLAAPVIRVNLERELAIGGQVLPIDITLLASFAANGYGDLHSVFTSLNEDIGIYLDRLSS
jgi:hypothetical protein